LSRLVISTKSDRRYSNPITFSEIEKSPFKEEIIYTNYVHDDDIPYLLNSAEAFVYPSFYEGFGLPVLEAMKSGVPVITSNKSSMPEVGGEACLYIDPNSVEDLYNQLVEIIMNKNLQKELSIKGIEQSKKFTWKNCAEKTLNVYEGLI